MSQDVHGRVTELQTLRYHASGHIDGPGMEWLIDTIAPEKIIAVHTQQLRWFEERWPEKVIKAEYGVAVRLD